MDPAHLPPPCNPATRLRVSPPNSNRSFGRRGVSPAHSYRSVHEALSGRGADAAAGMVSQITPNAEVNPVYVKLLNDSPLESAPPTPVLLKFDDVPDDCELPVGSRCSFVESSWFQGCVAVVIVANVAMTIFEFVYPETSDLFYAPISATLVFYVLEICCKVTHFRLLFPECPTRLLMWILLDITSALVGLISAALSLRSSLDSQGDEFEGLIGIFKGLMCLRLLRVFKIAAVFLQGDLAWAESAWFQSFIGGVITFNSVLMGLETDIDWFGWFYVEQVLLVIYSFELSIRLKKYGISFFAWSNPDFNWNWLDFAIVSSSAADSWLIPFIKLVEHASTGAQAKGGNEKGGMNISQLMMLMRMLRLLRILRLVKLVKTIEPLYILVTGVAAAVQSVMWVLVLTVVVLYAVSIMSTRLIGHGLIFDSDAIPVGASVFATVTDSMFILFRFMSGSQSDGEDVMIDSLIHSAPTFKFTFVFFMVTSQWTMLSTLTAVVNENMIVTCADQSDELKMLSYEEDRRTHTVTLVNLFTSMDQNHNGMLEYSELEAILGNSESAKEIARLCRVPVSYVREVFKVLSRHDGSVAMDVFVEVMPEIARLVTEQSVMKIQAQLLDTSSAQEKALDDLHANIQQSHNKILAGAQFHGEILERLCGAAQAVSLRQDELEREMCARLDAWERGTQDTIDDARRKIQALRKTLASAPGTSIHTLANHRATEAE